MKNKKKGFTLVELIVVLAILAILAAMLVPALTGYIDKANSQKVIATTRQVVMAAQTELSEEYATKGADGMYTGNDEKKALATSETLYQDIVKLAEVSSDGTNFKNGVSAVTIEYNKKGTVVKVTVTQNGKTCTYDVNASNGGYTVS